LSLSRSKPREAPYAGPSWHRAALYLGIALLAQVSVLHFLPLRSAKVSPVLVVVVWYAIAADARRAALLGLIAGFCEEMLSAGTGGAWTISTTLTAILAGVLSRGFFADSMPLVAGIVVFASLLRMFVFWLVMEAEGYPTGMGCLHFHAALWQAAINAAAILIVMLVGRYRDDSGRLQ